MKKVFKYSATLAGASLFLMIISIASRGVGFLREIIFANEFGLSEEFDIYLIASVIPLTINTIIYYIGQNYFIPVFAKFSNDDESKPFHFFINSLFLFGFIGLSLNLLLYFFSSEIIKLFVLSDEIISGDVDIIFKVFSFSLPVASVISILSAYLNSRRRFISPSVSIVYLNLLIIISVVLFNEVYGTLSIAIGYLAGSLIQLVYLFWVSNVRKVFSEINSQYKFRFWNDLGVSLLMIIFIESIGQFYAISDRFFFNSVSLGGISAISYSQTIINLPISIIALSFGTAIFPKFSKDIQNIQTSGFESSFKDSIVITLLLFIPIFYIFHFFREEIVSALLQRGQFTESHAKTTADTLMYFNFGVIFYAVYLLFNKMIYGAGLVKQLLIITIIGIILKITLNNVLVRRMDYNGLALSTTLSYLFFFLSSALIIFRYFKLRWILSSSFEFILLFGNGFIALTVANFILHVFIFNGLLFVVINVLLFVGIYLLNLLLINHQQTKLAIKRLLSFNDF